MGFAVCNRDGRFVETNARFRDLTAYSEERLASLEELQITHPEDRDAEEMLLEDLLEGRREHYVIEKRYRRDNGSTVWVRISVHLADGQVVRLVEDISDAVTAAQEAERFHKEALAAQGSLEARMRQQEALARLGTAALPRLRLKSFFQKTCETLAEMLEVPNTKVLELAPEKDRVLLRAGVGWKDGLVGNASVSIGPDSQAGYTLMSDHPVVVRDLQKETRFSGPPLLHDHNIRSGMSVIIRGAEEAWGVLGVHDTRERVFSHDDVRFLQSVAHILSLAIQRHDAEERLRAANRSLEQRVAKRTDQLQGAYDSLESFNYMVAHDLRGPLQSMRIAATLIQKEADPQTAERVQALEESAQRMLRLVDDLLEFARAGESHLQRAPVDLGRAAREAAKKYSEGPRSAEVRFVSPDGPVTVQADPALMQVVMDNLVGNAWKFSAGASEPVVEFGKDTDSVFFVRDNGPGFEPEQAEELFMPFHRVHGIKFPGSGIGLATVSRIIERHEGKVWAESSPGKGATFYFTVGPTDPE